MFKRNKKVIEDSKKETSSKVGKTNKSKKSYEKEYVVEPLRLMLIIVNRYQGDYYINKLKENGVAASFLCNGSGTATRDIYDVLGVGETKKDVIFALVRKDKVSQICKIAQDKFNVSKNAKGVVITVPIDSISGVLLYRFFTDTKENIKKETSTNGKQK